MQATEKEHTHRCTQLKLHTLKHAYAYKQTQIHTLKHIHTDRHTNRHTESRNGKKTHGQAEIIIHIDIKNYYTHIHTDTYTLISAYLV